MTHHAGWPITGTGGRLLVEQMRASGVEYLFTNPGSAEVGLLDALHSAPEITLILGLHEGLVVPMADAYARVTGKPGCVNVHVIAGTAQMAGQLYNAFTDRSPVVVTAGLKDNEGFNDDAILGPTSGFTQKEINRQFTKTSWEIRDPAVIPHAFRRAVKVASAPPTGPTYVAFTDDVLEATGITADIVPQAYFSIPGRTRPDENLIEQAAGMIVDAGRPVLMAGDGVWRDGAQAELLEFAELFAIPVTTSFDAYQNFPTQHPLWCDRHGPPVYDGQHGDLLISVGARTAGWKSLLAGVEYPAEPRTIVLHHNPDDMGRTYPMDLAILSDIRQALRALIEAVKDRLPPHRLAAVKEARLRTITAYTDAIKRRRSEEIERHFTETPIHPTRLGYELERTLDPDTIVVNECFSGEYDMMTFGFRPGEKLWIGTKGNSLGWGIGAAIGTQLGQPDRPVVCSIGDGAVMYSASGFWTMARYGVPVLTVVWNNYNYQIVRAMIHGYGGESAAKEAYPGMFLGDPDIDFVALARSQGVDGERVTEPDGIGPALRRGIAATRAGSPYLIDVVVARLGGGAASTWHQPFNLASRRKSARC
ncbi:MAG: thiamine pyrophosphate-binding protein [Candidatus Latescibacteria bacterium]|nr:thiamine pyrophosphate-binding protein [Candidatus Latescibacterota bacterium]